jgi:broad specificity phosphatase PhoE
MVAEALHLIRHGEVDNPEGIIYGRLPGYPLTERGQRMAATAADALEGEPVTRLIASPLLRTQQSAAPIAQAFGLAVEPDERIIEAGNLFEGRRTTRSAIARDPRAWRLLRNPSRPSWGEPYAQIVRRMHAAIVDALAGTESGHVVLVTHQLPIWMVHRSILGQPLPHDPRRRRCALSSITTLGRRNGRLVETGYAEPAAALLTRAVDRGAT